MKMASPDFRIVITGESEKKQPRSRRIFLTGFVWGSVALMVFYVVVTLAISKDPTHPFNQFLQRWPWMSMLVLGFGVQMGLVLLLRKGRRQHGALAAGGNTALSGTAMVACCAHHVSEALPILGISGLATVLVDYQEKLLWMGILSNAVGIGWMLWVLSGSKLPLLMFRSKVRNHKAAL